MNMKMKIFDFLLVSCCFCAFTENGMNNIERFVKGNISDKTAAVQSAKGNEAVWLSNTAMNFALESKEIIGNDRDLDTLAVAAITSFPHEYLKTDTENVKAIILNNLILLFESFTSSADVQKTAISKASEFGSVMDISPFIKSLNKYLSATDFSTANSEVVNSILNLLATYGDNESFTICYYLLASNKYLQFNGGFENVIVSRLPVSMNEAIAIANSPDLDALAAFFSILCKNKQKINQNFLSEIAVNSLSNTILTVKASKETTSVVTNLQIEALTVLSESKWTRASSVALSFFDYAKDLYTRNEISDDDFVAVITSLGNVSPLEAVHPLSTYLGNLNSMAEKKQAVSEPVALAVINTLGAIGDKSAFDALLGVTYFDYPQSVLSAAREALSGLKW